MQIISLPLFCWKYQQSRENSHSIYMYMASLVAVLSDSKETLHANLRVLIALLVVKTEVPRSVNE